jgi:hypothetical protein
VARVGDDGGSVFGRGRPSGLAARLFQVCRCAAVGGAVRPSVPVPVPVPVVVRRLG